MMQQWEWPCTRHHMRLAGVIGPYYVFVCSDCHGAIIRSKTKYWGQRPVTDATPHTKEEER